MIPADVASRVRLVSDLTTQPAPPAQKIADALSEFVPGQRVMAMIQALLPNGTYRAMVAQQREITLALPFAAKPGDALELEVVDTNGRLALAIATRKDATPDTQNASVATRLTVTGRLIAELLADIDKEGGKRPTPAPLSDARPVVGRFPQNAAELAPALKTALAKSGMFYESHQAQWAQGKTALETLLQEPQGRLSPAAQILLQQGREAAAQSPFARLAQPQSAPSAQAAQTMQSAQAQTQTSQTQAQLTGLTANAQETQASAANARGMAGAQQSEATRQGNKSPEEGALRVGMGGRAVATELTALVRQQLEALATHSYVWQGQIWPGQDMEWEIVDEDAGQEREENTAANWTTRVNLTLPRLGGVGATLKLSGGKEIEITLRTENETARRTLLAANMLLQRQFETAGLQLKSLAVARPAKSDEPLPA